MMYKNSSINTRKKLLALAIGCALSGGNLHAQEEEPRVSEDPEDTIEEIVVRGCAHRKRRRLISNATMRT